MLNGVAQKPIEGVSMAYSFANASAPSVHQTQYFEMLGKPSHLSRWLGGGYDPATLAVGIQYEYGPGRFPVGALPRLGRFFRGGKLGGADPAKLKNSKASLTRSEEVQRVSADASLAERLDPATRPNLTPWT